MSKSILLIDADSCERCPAGRHLISSNPGETCACEILSFMKDEIRGVDEYADCKPDWCPLRDLPEKKFYDCTDAVFVRGAKTGWNNCIDEIMKGANGNRI